MGDDDFEYTSSIANVASLLGVSGSMHYQILDSEGQSVKALYAIYDIKPICEMLGLQHTSFPYNSQACIQVFSPDEVQEAQDSSPVLLDFLTTLVSKGKEGVIVPLLFATITQTDEFAVKAKLTLNPQQFYSRHNVQFSRLLHPTITLCDYLPPSAYFGLATTRKIDYIHISFLGEPIKVLKISNITSDRSVRMPVQPLSDEELAIKARLELNQSASMPAYVRRITRFISPKPHTSQVKEGSAGLGPDGNKDKQKDKEKDKRVTLLNQPTSPPDELAFDMASLTFHQTKPTGNRQTQTKKLDLV